LVLDIGYWILDVPYSCAKKHLTYVAFKFGRPWMMYLDGIVINYLL